MTIEKSITRYEPFKICHLSFFVSLKYVYWCSSSFEGLQEANDPFISNVGWKVWVDRGHVSWSRLVKLSLASLVTGRQRSWSRPGDKSDHTAAQPCNFNLVGFYKYFLQSQNMAIIWREGPKDVYLCGCCVWMYLHLCAVLWMCVSVYWTPINKDKLHLLSSLISPPHPSLSSAAAPLAAHKLPTAQKVERSLHELYPKLLIIMSISNHWNTSWSFAWSNFQPLKIKVWISTVNGRV